jgi:hypothetical protein
VWAASLGPACAARAALVARHSTPLGGERSAIYRNAGSSKATLKFDGATATKFLMHHPLFSGCTNWPRLEKVKGKKRAAGGPAASVATAVDLGTEEGGVPPARCSNSSHLGEAVYATGAPAGGPRANAHYMKLYNEGVARCATSWVSAQEYAEATRRDFINTQSTSPSAPPSYGQVVVHWSSITDASSALTAAHPTTPRLDACCDSVASPQAPWRRLCSARPIEVCQLFK